MNGMMIRSLTVLAAFVIAAAGWLTATATRAVPARIAGDTKLEAAFAKVPLAFEANAGQTDASVRFLARGPGYNLFLTEGEAVLSLSPGHSNRAPTGETAAPAVLRIGLHGARPPAGISGEEALTGKISYFRGKEATGWRTGVPTYAKVRYRDVYPGIDLIYYGNQGQLEYDLVVAPGADPTSIGLVFDGADCLRLDASGNLIVQLGDEDLIHRAPFVYQTFADNRLRIPAHYVIMDNDEVRIELGAYDSDRTLVIDPVLVYSTYFGASGFESGNAIAVDAVGNAYVAGETGSLDFPGTDLAPPTFDGPKDAFVAKFNAAGSELIYSVYFGGNNVDFARGIAVDEAGNAYLSGGTYSADFPVMNALQPIHGGHEDGFAVKIDPTGSELIYSTYFGGSDLDRANDIAIDGEGNAYLSGTAYSTDLPVRNALQSTSGGGGRDAFVAKIETLGSTLVYATYLGGSGIDQGNGIAVDGAGCAYVTGSTESSDFPIESPLKPHLSGGSDAFVAKLNAPGTALVYSTYLGGDRGETGYGVAVDRAGNAYAVGATESADFATEGTLQTTLGGAQDAFVAKIDSEGAALLYATYLGGRWMDHAASIGVDRKGNAYVAGSTMSSDFPTTPDAPQPSKPILSFDSGFVSKLDPSGSSLVFSTFLSANEASGFESYNSAHDIAVDSAGNAYVTGMTQSTDFPTRNALQPEFAGIYDAFVTKISDHAAPPRLRTDRDFNGDGIPDLAVLTGDGARVTVKDSGGELIGSIAFDRVVSPVAFRTMDDFAGTLAPELVVLGTEGVAEIRDGGSGELLGNVVFDPQLLPVDLVVLTDFNGNGVPALAMLGKTATDAGQVELRDAAIGKRVARIAYSAILRPMQLIATDDITGDGVQELAMLGDHPNPQASDRIEVRDPATGGRLSTLWTGSGFDAARVLQAGDLTGDGIAELATVRTKPDLVNVAIGDPARGVQVSGFGFARGFSPIALVSIADINGNGAFETGLLARDPASGTQRVDFRDSRSGQLLNRFWMPVDFVAQAAETLPDLNANGAEEVAVLARRELDGALRVDVRDGKNGTLLRRIAF